MNLKELIKIKRLQKEDINGFLDLVELFSNVFEMEQFSMPNRNHLQTLLDREDFLVFVVILGDKVIGGLTSYVLQQYYSEKPIAYLYDLTIDIEYQRQGIGKQLIREVHSFFKEQGFEELFVQAEKVDQYAIDFYRKTNPSQEDQVLQFSYLLNK
jgi:aminoglycoside 3-N-acetyltransferase I